MVGQRRQRRSRFNVTSGYVTYKINILEHPSDELAAWLDIAMEAAVRVARLQVGMDVLAKELGQFAGLDVCFFWI